MPAEPDLFGRLELREAIARYLGRTKGINCSSDQVVVFSQTQNALNTLCRLLLNEGDRIAVEEPGPGMIKNTAFLQRLLISAVEVDDQGLKVHGGLDQDQQIDLVYVTPAHQDPRGVTLSQPRRLELLALAQKRGMWVVEDDFDSDFNYGSKPILPLAALDSGGNVIYLSSFWKRLYPLTAVGYLVVPPGLIELLKTAKTVAEPDSSVLEHLALADFIGNGHMERHLRRVRKVYMRRRAALLLALKTNFKEKIQIARYSAGTHQLVRFSLSLDDQTIQKCAVAAGLGMESTRNHYLGQPRPGEFLVDFTAIGLELYPEVIASFHRAVGERIALQAP